MNSDPHKKPPGAGANQPPGLPWRELHPNFAAHSYLCFYYTSSFSGRAVRDVNRVVANVSGGHVADCKVDPNWETGTFGLFSTCQQAIRRGAVNNRSPYLFFFGDHAAASRERGVAGYYRLRWYAEGGTYAGDFCLAADKLHFVERPISFAEVNAHLGTKLSNRVPRLSMKLSTTESLGLLAMLEQQPDATAAYIREVRRLEQINARISGGLKYVNFGRTTSFTWDAAKDIKSLGIASTRTRSRNSTPENRWWCASCHATHVSRALLKLCPTCGEHGTLHESQ